MADSFIQLPADSTGKQLDTVIVNMGVGTTAVHREKMVISDPSSTSGFATVTSSFGVMVQSTQPVQLTTGGVGGLTGFYKQGTTGNMPFTVSSSGPGTLYFLSAFSTTVGVRMIDVYNATSANVVLGTSLPRLRLIGVISTGAAGVFGGQPEGYTFFPQGIDFSNAITVAHVSSTAGTLVVGQSHVSVVVAP